MRKIERTTQFKRDYRRESKGRHHLTLAKALCEIIEILVSDGFLAEICRDHTLTGDWKDHRECHIKPDLILIYQKPDLDTLQLVRLGSHSDLGF